MTSSAASGGLKGRTVLVPRGGTWGNQVADQLRAYGARPVIAPLIATEPTPLTPAQRAALVGLRAGTFDWLVMTSAAAVEALVGWEVEAGHQSVVPPSTQVAAVGPATAATLRAAGIWVDLVPVRYEARALAEALVGADLGSAPRVLVAQSDLAAPTLTHALAESGWQVTTLVAYRTVGVALDPALVADLEAGRIDIVLVTSGSVARSLVAQVPQSSQVTAAIAVIGPRTAAQARAAGLPVHVIAPTSTIGALLAELD